MNAIPIPEICRLNFSEIDPAPRSLVKLSLDGADALCESQQAAAQGRGPGAAGSRPRIERFGGDDDAEVFWAWRRGAERALDVGRVQQEAAGGGVGQAAGPEARRVGASSGLDHQSGANQRSGSATRISSPDRGWSIPSAARWSTLATCAIPSPCGPAKAAATAPDLLRVVQVDVADLMVGQGEGGASGQVDVQAAARRRASGPAGRDPAGSGWGRRGPRRASSPTRSPPPPPSRGAGPARNSRRPASSVRTDRPASRPSGPYRRATCPR